MLVRVNYAAEKGKKIRCASRWDLAVLLIGRKFFYREKHFIWIFNYSLIIGDFSVFVSHVIIYK